MKKEYAFNKRDIIDDDGVIPIIIPNIHNLRQEDIHKAPIKFKDCCVGHLEEADDDYLYGYFYNPLKLEGKDSFSFEIDKKEWIEKRCREEDPYSGVSYYDYYYCSECDYCNKFKQTNFCPNCGADMR